MNQQKSVENSSVNGISSEGISSATVSQNVSSIGKSLTKCSLCNDLLFAGFCPHKFLKYNLCSKRGHKETMCQSKSEFRKKDVTQNVKPMVSLVTKLISSSKEDMELSETPQENFHECFTIMNWNRNWKQLLLRRQTMEIFLRNK